MISTLQKCLQYALISWVGPSSSFRIGSHIGRDILPSLLRVILLIGSFALSLIWIIAQLTFGESLSKVSTRMIQTISPQDKKWGINTITLHCHSSRSGPSRRSIAPTTFHSCKGLLGAHCFYVQEELKHPTVQLWSGPWWGRWIFDASIWGSTLSLPEGDNSCSCSSRPWKQGYGWHLDQEQVPQGHHAIQQGHVFHDSLKAGLSHLNLKWSVAWVYCHEHHEQDHWQCSCSCPFKEEQSHSCFEGQGHSGRRRGRIRGVWPRGHQICLPWAHGSCVKEILEQQEELKAQLQQ